MMTQKFIPRATVIRMALISELGLLLLSALSCWLANLSVAISFELTAIAYGALTCLPMLLCNILIFGYLSKEGSPYPVYGDFKRTVVIPLCGNLDVLSAFLLALCSGFAEELFFRGVLYTYLNYWLIEPIAAIIVSALFAYVHLIGAIKRYWQISIFYFLFGLYFCAIFIASKNLTSAIVSHALYNFCAILYLRYVEIPRSV